MLKKIVNNNHFLSLCSNGFTALFGLLSFMLIARVYEKEIFGLWVLYLSGFSFVEMIKAGVLHGALVKYLAGASGEDQQKIIGSSLRISIVLTLLVTMILYGCYWFFPQAIDQYGMTYFFKYYPILGFINLPINYAIWISQAREKFNRILIIRGVLACLFLLAVTSNLLIHYDMEVLVQLHVMIHLVLALSLTILGYAGVKHIMFAKRSLISELINFGKYSFGTLIGTNLLKSADTFIIGFFMGPAFVAIYSIPLRLTELIEIPLRSLVANALPKIATASNQKDELEVKNLFYQYAGILSILFLPFMVIAFVFAEELVTLVGGAKYADTAIIFQIFCVYGLFLSLDRFSGVTLDAINKPKYNLIKVTWMAIANIVGDILIIWWIGEVWAVALVTVINVLIGVIVGLDYLKKYIPIQLSAIFWTGWLSIQIMIKRRKHLLTDKT